MSGVEEERQDIRMLLEELDRLRAVIDEQNGIVERLRAENERLTVFVRKVAGWGYGYGTEANELLVNANSRKSQSP